jgi:hypothetical protein
MEPQARDEAPREDEARTFRLLDAVPLFVFMVCGALVFYGAAVP